MRRPTRKRRLSIAAMVSLLAFVVVAVADVRSFQISDWWGDGVGRTFGLVAGRVAYSHITSTSGGFKTHRRYSQNIRPNAGTFGRAIWGLRAKTLTLGPSVTTPPFLSRVKEVTVWVPLWPLLLLLLIAPVRWLIARPANTPAFPVITDAKSA